jgi:hypothetical protein
MAREAAYDRTDDRDDAQKGAFAAEHGLAWIMALASMALVAIGLLVGFGVISGDDEIAGTDIGEATGAAQLSGAASMPDWQEGLLWILPAITAGLLAYTLHETDHHRGRRRNTAATADDDSGKGMFSAEHGLAYLMAALAIAGATLGVLVGFDVFDNGNTFADGMLWSVASIAAGSVAMALHNVRHHQLATEEDVIVRIIEERTGTITTARGARVGERATDRPGERPL